MRVQDVMTRDVRTISPGSTADEAIELMRRHGFHHLVVASGGQILGVISDRDVGGRRGGALRRNRTVEELMTPGAVTVEPATTVKRVANLMRGRSIGCVVVTERGRVAGIVTVSDLLELVGRGIDRAARTSQRPPLSHRVPHRHQRAATGMW